MRCYAILMAAGFSSRFGTQNKLLTPFHGKPLARHALDLVCGMGCFEGIFFVYADAEVAALAQPAITAHLPVMMIHNPAPEQGQGQSAILGVRAADALAYTGEEPVYYFFLPCDQPLLDATTVYLLLDAARPGFIVEPGHANDQSCRTSPQHSSSPSVFSASFRNELLSLKPGESPRLLKSRHPHLVITIDVPTPAVLADIDTPADLKRLELRYTCGSHRKLL